MSALPPAGWYDDPEHAGTLRYWDGSHWTEHRAPGHGAGTSGSASGLSSIGSWLQTSFSALWDRRVPIGLFVAASAALWLALGVSAAWAVDEMRWTVDGGWTGVDGTRLWVVGAVAAANVVVGFVLYLAVIDQVAWTRAHENRSATASLGAAVRALPRCIGWSLVILLGVSAAAFAIALAALVSPVLGGLLSIAALVAGVWLVTKVYFLFVACVVPIPGTTAIAASAAVSKGRFWAIVGRVLIVSLLSIAISFAMGIPLSAGGPSDDDIDRAFVVEDDELVAFDAGAFVELAGLDPGLLLVASAIVQSLTPLLGLAAAAALYREVHGRPGRSA